MSMEIADIDKKDIVLSADERYDIWEIKRSERSHLMKSLDDESNDNTCNDGDDDNTPCPLPLLDGCDIKGWRQSRLVTTSDYMQGFLNIGSGCPLIRRESQFPVLSSRSLSKWKVLQCKLFESPKATAQRIYENDATLLSRHPVPFFEKENIPVILEGLTKSWKAMEACTFDHLVNTFGDHEWRFSDTHGCTMTLNTYKKYISSIEGQTDDAPLAVYDSQLHTDERKFLLTQYQVPKCFDTLDLFDCLDGDKRPPFRWILVGPARSGTGLHIDPLGTHAWVTLIEGVKRWVLFPYGTDKSVIGMQEPQIPSAIWFSSNYYQRSMKVKGVIEILQRPGETVYVPAGWPHIVLNLEFSTAITHNYASEYPSMTRIVKAVNEEEPEIFGEWIQKLRKSRSDLRSEITWETVKTIGPACNGGRPRHNV